MASWKFCDIHIHLKFWTWTTKQSLPTTFNTLSVIALLVQLISCHGKEHFWHFMLLCRWSSLCFHIPFLTNQWTTSFTTQLPQESRFSESSCRLSKWGTPELWLLTCKQWLFYQEIQNMCPYIFNSNILTFRVRCGWHYFLTFVSNSLRVLSNIWLH